MKRLGSRAGENRHVGYEVGPFQIGDDHENNCTAK